MADETIITDCSELNNLSSNVTSLIIGSNVCNLKSVTLFNLTNYDNLESIEIGVDSFMYVSVFVIDGLNRLKSLKIGKYSFTTAKSGYGNDDSLYFHLMNCAELESIEIGLFSFSTYAGGCELRNLPNLKSIIIGEIGSTSCNFFYSSFVVKGIKI